MYCNQHSDDVLVLSLSKLGEGFKLARNFSLWEFQCSDGSDTIKVHPAGILLLQNLSDDVAEDVGKRISITVTSAFRTLSFNRSIGSKDTSFHIKGMAYDVIVNDPEWDINKVDDWATKNNVGGKGYYPATKSQHSFNHLDVGPKRRWTR